METETQDNERSKFCTIFDWMFRDLGLTGNSVIVYAIIYHFSLGDNCFNGSLKYLQEFVGVSKPTIINILKCLEEKGLITKKVEYKNRIKFCEYRTNLTGGKETLPPVKNLNEGGKETLLTGGKKTLPNNKYIDIKNNNKSIYTHPQKEAKFNPVSYLHSQYQVDTQTAKDWIQIRKGKRLQTTKTSIDAIAKKANKVGLSVDSLIRFCCEKGWAGFEVSWFKKHQQEESGQEQSWGEFFKTKGNENERTIESNYLFIN